LDDTVKMRLSFARRAFSTLVATSGTFNFNMRGTTDLVFIFVSLSLC